MTLNYNKLPQHIVGTLFFLFPILSILVKDWVSFTFLVLTLGGMTYGLKSWKSLTIDDTKIFIGFAVFCGLIALSFIEVDDMRTGFRHFEKYTSFLFAIFPYLLLRRLNYDFSKYFIAGVLTAPIVWLAYYYIYGDGGRFEGAYYAIFTGDFSVLMASLSMAYLVTMADTNIKKMLSILVFLLCTITAVYSQTRGAWIYYPGLFVLLIVMFRKSLTIKQYVPGSVLLVFIVVFSIYNPPDIIKNRIDNTLSEYQLYKDDPTQVTSTGVRLQIWRDSLKMFAESPFIGVGIGDFEAQTKLLIKNHQSQTPQIYGHAHNVFFNILATTGLLGFAGLVFYIFWLPLEWFIDKWGNADSSILKFYALSGIILITAFMVFGLTESWLSRNPLVRTYLIIFVLFYYATINNKCKVDCNE